MAVDADTVQILDSADHCRVLTEAHPFARIASVSILESHHAVECCWE